ncbi:MAG: PrsW family intramembrane metalloprotease [Anaerolineales bacterium]|nr:PrsW family intramembrane metalloprotease [Anaerolineales bacterium]
MALILSLLFGFIPMLINAAWVYWLDRYEQEPKRLLGFVFLWGALIAAAGAFIFNTIWETGFYLLTSSERLSSLSTYIISAPLVEEFLKGIAVFFVYQLYRHEFDSIMDGIVYAAITALGFAAAENSLYIFEKGYLANGYAGLFTLTFIRVIIVGWQHPFYTSFIGIGLAISRLTRSTFWKYTAPTLGFSAAVFTHSLHNLISSIYPSIQTCLLGIVVDWSGWIAMFSFVVYTILRERHLLEKYLREEIALGTLTEAQFNRTLSFTHRTFDPLIKLFQGQNTIVRRFYQLCGELAHKKAQHTQIEDDLNYQKWIEAYRSELSQISRLLSS